MATLPGGFNDKISSVRILGAVVMAAKLPWTQVRDMFTAKLANLLGAQLNHITITFPSQGSILKLGQTYTVRWTSFGVRGNVKIVIKRTSGETYVIAPSAPNNGSCACTIPLNANPSKVGLMGSGASTHYSLTISSLDGSIKGTVILFQVIKP